MRCKNRPEILSKRSIYISKFGPKNNFLFKKNIFKNQKQAQQHIKKTKKYKTTSEKNRIGGKKIIGREKKEKKNRKIKVRKNHQKTQQKKSCFFGSFLERD
jgi:hypothetical protein